MGEPGDVTRLRLVGGNLGLDFINSRSGPPVGEFDDDVLLDYDALVEWAVYAGAISGQDAAALRRAAAADPEAAAAAHAHALRIRDDLDRVLRAVAAGDRPDGGALERVRDAAADALRYARLEPGASFTWSWAGDRSLERPVRPAVHAAVTLLLGDRLHRLKQCAGCSFLFIDESKNGSRRWCSMDDCGTDQKMQRYVAARRAKRT